MRTNGLHEIASRFDGMLIDQFGVIHDGQKLYPGTARVLAELNALRAELQLKAQRGAARLRWLDRLDHRVLGGLIALLGVATLFLADLPQELTYAWSVP
jgi:hypothetical protein